MQKISFYLWETSLSQKCFTKINVPKSWKCVYIIGTTSFYKKNYTFPLMGNMFPRLGKLAFTRKMCVFTSGKYVTLLGKIVFKANNSFNSGNYVFTTRKDTGIPLLGRQFLQRKTFLSAIGKCVCTNRKKRFYRQKHVPPLEENMLPQLEKTTFTGKHMSFHQQEYASTARNIYLHQLKINH